MAKRVLIVDDDPDLAALLRTKLELRGIEVRVALDGPLALQEAQRFRPDLIILDIMFPAGGGLTVLQRLKLSVFTNTKPIVVVTASDEAAIKEKALHLGVAAYIHKPFDTERLIADIQQLLEPAAQ